MRERAEAAAARSHRPRDAAGIALTPLEREVTGDRIRYPHVAAELDRPAGIAEIIVHGPRDEAPDSVAAIHGLGAAFWPLAVTRELDDLILRLRTNELELGTWTIRTSGDIDRVLGYEELLAAHRGDWLAGEIRHYWKRTLKRLDVTSRSLIALIEPGNCFAGPLLELALATDRQYMLDGTAEDGPAAGLDPAAIVVTQANFGAFPMANGLSRLASRFYGDPGQLAKLRPAGQAGGGDRAADRGRRGARAWPGHLRPGRHRLGRRGAHRPGGTRLAQPGRVDRHGGQPPFCRP